MINQKHIDAQSLSPETVQRLHMELKKLPNIQAPDFLEQRIMAAVEGLEVQHRKAKRYNAIWGTMMVLSSPLWFWLATQTQRLTINRLLWKLVTVSNSIKWSDIFTKLIDTLTPIQSLTLIYATFLAAAVYGGCLYGYWYVLREQTPQSLAT